MRVVVAMGGTLDEADDIVSEAMVDVMRRWSELDNVDAYARAAVTNSFHKQRKRSREGLIKAVRGGHLSPESDECAELTAWEDKQWVDQRLCALPRAQREVAEAIFEGLTVEQISVLLGCTPSVIRQRLMRATRKLAQLRTDRSRGDDGGEIQ